MNSTFLSTLKIHSDWKAFLTEENINIITKIQQEIGENYTPPSSKVLRFLEIPLSEVKIIILGQDPYPQPKTATGRAFEVGTLQSWNAPFSNTSLKNILRTVYKAYSGEIIKYSDLKGKFDNEFPVLPPQKLFKHWEKEGVLLLNTSYTCELGKPGSHKNNWKAFTSHLLNFINDNFSNVTWFLWGNHALGATKEMSVNNSIFCQHPMMCYNNEGRDTDFLYGNINCFAEFMNEIDWTGYQLKPGNPAASLF